MGGCDMGTYPTVEELKMIREYDIFNNDIGGLLELIKSIWWGSGWGFSLKGKKVLYLELHTGGWSGNEDIIEALRVTMFWAFYWKKTIRGGHYFFKIRQHTK
jgi:hypothetical protein